MVPSRSRERHVARAGSAARASMAMVVLGLLSVGLIAASPTASAAARARKVVAGGFHTCAMTRGGAVWCWGSNVWGQLGIDPHAEAGEYPADGLRYSTPQSVVGLQNGVVDIAAGFRHTCAVTSGGRAMCWGRNSFGQLGDGSHIIRSSPVDVRRLHGVESIDAGWNHTCALTTSGRVRCWGQNSRGQLGDGTRTRRMRPTLVAGLGDVVAVSAGDYHTCALTGSGRVKCWGNNHSGTLGDGTRTDRTEPVQVVGLTSGVMAISAGGSQTCALLEFGRVRCWGYRPGDGTSEIRTEPIDVGLTHVVSIAAGREFMCAARRSGSVFCWGENRLGSLGVGTRDDLLEPTATVRGISDAGSVAAGQLHACAVTRSGRLRCWGNNSDGELGDGTRHRRSRAVDVVGF